MTNFRTFDLAVSFYKQAKGLRLPAHLTDQLLRAASSVALNLAEGRGRPTRRDQARFFGIAFASAKEVQAILNLEVDTKDQLHNLADSLAAHIHQLRKACLS